MIHTPQQTHSHISDIRVPVIPTAIKDVERLPTIKVNGVATVRTRLLDKGFQVTINNKSIRITYPKTIWQRFPKTHRNILAQNITYAATFQLPYLYQTIRKVNYNIPVPLIEAFLFKGLALALPSTAIMQAHKSDRVTSNLIRKLYDIDYVFSRTKSEIPPYNRTSFSDHAIMPFTFGKDSLLTYALARELGIQVHPVYISEPYYPYEEYVKKFLSIPFQKEFKTRLNILRNTLGVLREPVGWYGWELQLTQYSFMLLPYVYAKKAGYILFSNEQSCNEAIVDNDGFRCNPVFEQSHSWLLQNSLMASIVGGNSLSIGTFLEPLHELAIIRILHKRYPEIAKYQSSCDLSEKPKSGPSRWCENCSKCGRMFIFLLANGIDPKTVGFRHMLLRQKDHHLYSLFNTNRVMEFGYDQSEAGSNEMIFAFYLAYRKGYKGPVMKSFIQKYLRSAQKNSRQLRKTFYGIHSSRTVPDEVRSRLIRIYQQELKKVQ